MQQIINEVASRGLAPSLAQWRAQFRYDDEVKTASAPFLKTLGEFSSLMDDEDVSSIFHRSQSLERMKPIDEDLAELIEQFVSDHEDTIEAYGEAVENYYHCPAYIPEDVSNDRLLDEWRNGVRVWYLANLHAQATGESWEVADALERMGDLNWMFDHVPGLKAAMIRVESDALFVTAVEHALSRTDLPYDEVLQFWTLCRDRVETYDHARLVASEIAHLCDLQSYNSATSKPQHIDAINAHVHLYDRVVALRSKPGELYAELLTLKDSGANNSGANHVNETVNCLLASLEVQSRLTLLQTACAIDMHQQMHQEWPTSLDEVNDFTPDSFTGKPPVYRRTDDGGIVLSEITPSSELAAPLTVRLYETELRPYTY